MIRIFSIAFLVALCAPHALADPCGMVPPIPTYQSQGWQGAPIQRVGHQKTYVFFKDGVETMVIRPGFKGIVDNFGMLIPFPSAPSIRKVSDNTFAHLEKAANPPIITLDLRPMPAPPPMPSERSSMRMKSAPVTEAPLRVDEVRVVRQEAVGMYEIAVLEAGSPKALNLWMADHGYQYPTGMDGVVGDYVKDRWFFVAVKARVGVKSRVDPKPGMRKAKPKMRAGGTFDGHVQAMGFRFKVKAPVIPMRLSSFNEGELYNIIYYVGPKGAKLQGLPKSLVAQQVPGKKLHSNVNDLLALKVIWNANQRETLGKIKPDKLKWMKAQRDPTPHNGIARELMASDLLAIKRGELVLSFEEDEKAMLNISERLGLRGPEVDGQLVAEGKRVRERALKRADKDLKKMTMTVFKGDLPREFISKNNLRMEPYTAPAPAPFKLVGGRKRAPKQPRASSRWGRPPVTWTVPVVDRAFAKRVARKWPELKYWAKEEVWTP